MNMPSPDFPQATATAYLSTQKAIRLLIWLVALLVVVEVVYPKLKKNADDRAQIQTQQQIAGQAFPEAVCAEEKSVDYPRSRRDPLAVELREGCHKRVTIHVPPDLQNWNFTTTRKTLKFRFFGDSAVYNTEAGRGFNFGGKGAMYESCPDYNGICSVVRFEVALAESGSDTVVFSRSPAEKNDW